MNHVWMEGYNAQGTEPVQARYLGLFRGETFEESCRTAASILVWMPEYYDAERNTWWGCRLFDNETDARKTFG